MKNALMIVRSMSTPIIAAASRSCETERIARPRFVRFTKSVRRIIRTTAVTITRIRTSEIRSGPTWMPEVTGM